MSGNLLIYSTQFHLANENAVFNRRIKQSKLSCELASQKDMSPKMTHNTYKD